MMNFFLRHCEQERFVIHTPTHLLVLEVHPLAPAGVEVYAVLHPLAVQAATWLERVIPDTGVW